ncbi:MAG: hypothetical protein OXB99_13580 [Acidimicrobiaceae bacterium]|nr:hypothetical protein [Acidimicrobiaceae bacterium]
MAERATGMHPAAPGSCASGDHPASTAERTIGVCRPMPNMGFVARSWQHVAERARHRTLPPEDG